MHVDQEHVDIAAEDVACYSEVFYSAHSLKALNVHWHFWKNAAKSSPCWSMRRIVQCHSQVWILHHLVPVHVLLWWDPVEEIIVSEHRIYPLSMALHCGEFFIAVFCRGILRDFIGSGCCAWCHEQDHSLNVVLCLSLHGLWWMISISFTHLISYHTVQAIWWWLYSIPIYVVHSFDCLVCESFSFLPSICFCDDVHPHGVPAEFTMLCTGIWSESLRAQIILCTF